MVVIIEEVHFDTRQYNHIVWEMPDELYEKLKNLGKYNAYGFCMLDKDLALLDEEDEDHKFSYKSLEVYVSGCQQPSQRMSERMKDNLFNMERMKGYIPSSCGNCLEEQSFGATATCYNCGFFDEEIAELMQGEWQKQYKDIQKYQIDKNVKIFDQDPEWLEAS